MFGIKPLKRAAGQNGESSNVLKRTKGCKVHSNKKVHKKKNRKKKRKTSDLFSREGPNPLAVDR